MENLALRHQLLVLHRTVHSPALRSSDRVFYFEYYHHSRPHRALIQDSPIPRPVMTPEQGKVVEFPQVGGLHHLYTRLAA